MNRTAITANDTAVRLRALRNLNCSLVAGGADDPFHLVRAPNAQSVYELPHRAHRLRKHHTEKRQVRRAYFRSRSMNRGDSTPAPFRQMRDLHFVQMRSPDQLLVNSLRHFKHRRVLASCTRSGFGLETDTALSLIRTIPEDAGA